MNSKIWIIIFLSTIFIVGCKSAGSSQQLHLGVGDSSKVSIPFNRWLGEFEDIEIVSTCKELSVSSDKIPKMKSGTIEAQMIVKEYSENLNNCLEFKSKDYSTSTGILILVNKPPLHFSVISFENSPKYNKEYPMNFEITIDDKTKELNYSITFSTTSPDILTDGKEINSYKLDRHVSIDTGTSTPSVKIRIGDTGDSSRTIHITAFLNIQVGNESYKVDFETISRTAWR